MKSLRKVFESSNDRAHQREMFGREPTVTVCNGCKKLKGEGKLYSYYRGIEGIFEKTRPRVRCRSGYTVEIKHVANLERRTNTNFYTTLHFTGKKTLVQVVSCDCERTQRKKHRVSYEEFTDRMAVGGRAPREQVKVDLDRLERDLNDPKMKFDFSVVPCMNDVSKKLWEVGGEWEEV